MQKLIRSTILGALACATSFQVNAAGGLLGPGASATANLNTDSATNNTNPSVVAMTLPTNDALPE